MMYGLSPKQPAMQGPIHIDPDRPAYVVIDKRGFFDDMDKLWNQGEMLYWEGPLSLGLDPINDLAIEKMRAYLQELDKKAEEVAVKKGYGHASMVGAFEARRRLGEMERNLAMPVNETGEVQILGVKKKTSKFSASVSEPVHRQQIIVNQPSRRKENKANG
jgi:hypothetical protein